LKIRIPIFSLILAIILLLFNASIASAVPPVPCSFYGTVKSGGINVPLDTIVSARINGVTYASKTVLVDHADTVYAFNVPGDEPETPGIIEGGVQGDTVLFYIGNQKADQTAPWCSGGNNQLNLTYGATQKHYIYVPVVVRGVKSGGVTIP
jgi:hypothetical protein